MNDETTTVVSVANRRLAAIMFTDIVGFSRQMGADEARTLRILAVHNQFIEQAVAAHQGHVIKTAGDGFLIEFPSIVHAVQCARHIQAQFHTYNGLCCRNSHGDNLLVILRCDTQENQDKVSPP